MESHREKPCSLAAHAITCRQELDRLSVDEDNAWARDQSAQFNMWAANTDVFGIGHRSLDSRLKDVPDMQLLMKQLLCSLERDLIKLRPPLPHADLANIVGSLQKTDKIKSQPLVEKDSESSDSSSIVSYKFLSSSEENDDENTSQALTGPRVAIQDTVDRLHRLATIIRRSGAQHRQVRIERFLEKPKNQQIYETFERLALQKAEHLFPKADNFLQRRIAKSIARRRSRFSYLQQHRQKQIFSEKESDHNPLSSKPSPPTPASRHDVATVAPHFLDQNLEIVGSGIETMTIATGRSILSATENTKLDLKRLEPARNERPDTVISAYISQSGFPFPPKLVAGKKTFKCPYCLFEYPANEARGKYWKQHVIKDFEPYFCVFNNCLECFEPSESFNDWIIHMEDCHMPIQWQCSSLDHDPKTFHSVEEFEGHIHTHDDKITDSLLSILTKHSARRDINLFETCPFCGGFPEEIGSKYPDRSIKVQLELQKHIRDHLMAIALILPPIVVDNFEGDVQTGSSPGLEQRDSILDLEEPSSDFKEYCDQESQGIICDCRDTEKNSSHKWSPLSIRAHNPNNAPIPTSFDDPAWPPEFQTDSGDLGAIWDWHPESLSLLSNLNGGWEFLSDYQPPYNQAGDPIILDLASYPTANKQTLESPLIRVNPNNQITKIHNVIILGFEFGDVFSRISWTCWCNTTPKNPIHQLYVSGSSKIPSKICYDDDGRVVKWGAMVSSADKNQAQWFKAAILRAKVPFEISERLSDLTNLLKRLNKSIVDVVADYFRCLFQQALEHIEDTLTKTVVDTCTFRVVLTVPAHSDPAAIALTLRAAKQLETSFRFQGPLTFTIVSEAESAMIAMMSAKQGTTPRPQSGDYFVYCNVGGLTVDLIAYKIRSLDTLKLETCVEPISGLCGDVFLDESFEALIRETVGSSTYEKIDPMVKESLFSNWKFGPKRNFDRIGGREFHIDIPGYKPKKRLFGKKPSSTVVLSPQQLSAIFAPITGKIVDMLRTMIVICEERMWERPKSVFLTGDLSENDILYQEVVKTYSPTPIIRLDNVTDLVSCGAVLMGSALEEDVEMAHTKNYESQTPEAIRHLILVIGENDAGKSSFIGKLTRGRNLKDQHKSPRVTMGGCEIVEVYMGKTTIFMMDCPALGDTARIYALGYETKGIIYLHQITDSIFEISATQNLGIIMRFIGDDACSNVVFTTTKWDKVTNSAERYAKERDLREIFWRNIPEGSITRFDGTTTSAEDTVAIIHERPSSVFQVHQELVDQQLSFEKTAVGAYLERILHSNEDNAGNI